LPPGLSADRPPPPDTANSWDRFTPEISGEAKIQAQSVCLSHSAALHVMNIHGLAQSVAPRGATPPVTHLVTRRSQAFALGGLTGKQECLRIGSLAAASADLSFRSAALCCQLGKKLLVAPR